MRTSQAARGPLPALQQKLDAVRVRGANDHEGQRAEEPPALRDRAGHEAHAGADEGLHQMQDLQGALDALFQAGFFLSPLLPEPGYFLSHLFQQRTLLWRCFSNS